MNVLIIGGSRGIGLEFVRQYRADKAQVTATARSDDALQTLRKLGATALQLDVASTESASRLGWQIEGAAFDVAIVVAGVYGPSTRGLQPPTEADFDTVMHTNVLGPMRVIPQIADALAPNAKLAVLSSRMGAIGPRSSASGWLYRASKAAVNSVLKDASIVLQGKATCVSFHPGWVRTDMGGEGADLAVDVSVGHMRRVIAGLSPADNGKFFDHDGDTHRMVTSPFWSEVVRGLVPYVPGEQPQIAGLVKLNTNENPYPPSPRVLAALHAEVGEGLRLYPEPTGRKLRETIAQHHGLTPDQVFVGNSSDEVLAHVFMALLNHAPRPLLFPDITYAFYPVYCGLYGIPYRAVPLADDLSLRIDDYLHAEAGAIIFPNPNAPTGRALPRTEIERLLIARPDTLVVIDEAYVDFGADSAVPLIAQHANLLVVHTLSKSRSLAGLRVGFAMGQAPLIEGLTRVKDSFNSYPLDRLATAGAIAAIEDVAYFEHTRDAVMATREWLVAALHTMGFETLPSEANFVFTRHPQHRGEALAAALRQQGVLVRRFAQPERIADHLRISVGDEAQTDRLLEALRNILADD